MLLRALALDGTDLDLLQEWHTLPELKQILMLRFAVVDSVGLDAFFGKFCQHSFDLQAFSACPESQYSNVFWPGCRL